MPFKMPSIFTRRILFNLDTGGENADVSHAAWEQTLSKNLTPPYISADADVSHIRLAKDAKVPRGVPQQFLIMCTDGLPELFEGVPISGLAQRYVDSIVSDNEPSAFDLADNLALRLLKQALGGEDSNALSQMVAVESDRPWMDDVTIVIQIL